MPNQRDRTKVFIGGYFDRQLAAGVGLWLKREKNRRKSASDFLYEAILEKLAREGIEVVTDQKTSFGRKLSEEAYLQVRELPNSTPDAAAKALAEKGAASVQKPVIYPRKRKAASPTGKTS